MLHDIFQFEPAVASVAYIINQCEDKRICLQNLYNILFDACKSQLLEKCFSSIGDSFYVTEDGFEPVIVSNLFRWRDSQSALWFSYFNTITLQEYKFAYLLKDPGLGELSQYDTDVLDSAWDKFIRRGTELTTQERYFESYPEYLAFHVSGKKVHISAEEIFRVNKSLDWYAGYKEHIQVRHELFYLGK